MDDEKARFVPHVTRILDRDGREGFQINDTRYLSITRSAEHVTNAGYLGTVSVAVFTWQGVREQLANEFGLDAPDIDEALRTAPTIAGEVPRLDVV